MLASTTCRFQHPVLDVDETAPTYGHTCIYYNGGASKTTRTVMARSSVSMEIDWEPTKFEFFFVPPYFSPSVALRELIDGFVSHIFSQTSFDEIALGEGHSTILSRGCGDFGTMISQ